MVLRRTLAMTIVFVLRLCVSCSSPLIPLPAWVLKCGRTARPPPSNALVEERIPDASVLLARPVLAGFHGNRPNSCNVPARRACREGGHTQVPGPL